MSPLCVDVWSDIACPWCWVGKRHLDAAIAAYDGTVDVTWRAYQLNPSAPKRVAHNMDYAQRLAAKYKTSRAGAQAMIDRMCEVGQTVGLEFRFDRICPTNTFDAHRLLSWSARRGVQTQLKERLFVAYMNLGLSVSDHNVLADLAHDVGLDADQVQATLATNAHAESVRSDQRQAGRIGVTGVPFFVVGERCAISGAQPPDVLLGAMQRAGEEADGS